MTAMTKLMNTVVATFVTLMIVVTVQDLWITHRRLQSLDKAWEADGPHTTVVWQARARLSAVSWLGPLRPRPPRDPYEECGIPKASNGRWFFLRRLGSARGRLGCLKEHMALARAEHEHLKGRFMILFVMVAVVTVILKTVRCARPGTNDRALVKEEKCSPPLGNTARGTEVSASRPVPEGLFLNQVASTFLGWRRPLDMALMSSRVISVHEKLRDAMKAAMSRYRRTLEGKKVLRDSLDWWRGKSKLVVQPPEHGREMVKPYQYPRQPSYVLDPYAHEARRPSPQQKQRQRKPSHRTIPWDVLSQVLLLVQTLILAYLFLREVANR